MRKTDTAESSKLSRFRAERGARKARTETGIRCALIVRIFIGMVYLISGIAKTFSPRGATNLLQSSFGISTQEAFVLSLLLSACEIAVGTLLCLGRVVALAAFVSIFFLLGSLIIGIRLIDNPVECGCFGEILTSKTDSLFMIRNTFLLISSMFLLRKSIPQGLGAHRNENVKST